MRGRGRWACAAGLAILAACDRAEPPPIPTASEIPKTLAAPLAPPVLPLVSPEPSPEAGAPSPADPSITTKPLAAYPPRDECAKLPGFSAFRDAVFAAVANRNGEALVSLADPEVHLDFGGGTGRDELRKRLADPKSGLWQEIATLSSLGCAADGTVATLPAIFSRVPDDVDAALTMLVTGTAVPLRRKPSPAAEAARTFDWALVTLNGKGFDPAARYSEVTASDGTTGFVATAKLRSVLDYRLIADKSADGEYRITALIAGD